jgi:hypothetical protein
MLNLFHTKLRSKSKYHVSMTLGVITCLIANWYKARKLANKKICHKGRGSKSGHILIATRYNNVIDAADILSNLVRRAERTAKSFQFDGVGNMKPKERQALLDAMAENLVELS